MTMITKFNLLNLLIFGSVLMSSGLQAQEVFGKWKVVNDAGRVNSIVEIYKKDNAIHGKVIRITKEEHRDRKCTECQGKLKNKPIEGLNVIRDFKKEGDVYVDGTLIDPKSGKEYKGKIWVDDKNPDKLNVRGYVTFFYKTKVWERTE
ncbi:DUF2147 domain-containing protein [Salegentibacter salegens]|uniref:Uncharacterized conserved protein, DUF2147 family n=1 Tax=Salegentibacter salegens TaxID=143223 RepID=A0A1M7JC60_9FLAO|nr:DUF2147 domain-containing protein [Salegentibacter salegens]PRX42804.1 uncharacterized protein (DUF2147 family) [Salegentibacter salegens]SHM50602.1 Uncharacterized conserved protein, DUF2147 family [Salegentibacter salegens]